MKLSDTLRELLKSWPGRIGAAMLFLLTVLSVFAALSFPLDFGDRVWADPARWADNPKAVPPAWSDLFNQHRRFPHRNVEFLKPVSSEPNGGGQTLVYALPIEFSQQEPPSFASISIADVTYVNSPPLFTISLVRPEGTEVVLDRLAVRGARPFETAPFRRFNEVPNRISLSNDTAAAQALSDFFTTHYQRDIPAATLRGAVATAMVSSPDAANPGRLTLLHGTYALKVTASLADARDSVGSVRFVLGGTAFGLMGTDKIGRDLAQGLAFGLPIALFIGIAASVMTTVIGTALGIIGGYMGGVADMAIQRVADIVNNVPLLPLLIFLVFIFGPHLFLIMFFLIAFSWPGLTIVIRTMVLQVRSGPLVESALAMGASKWRIMYRHVFPQTAPFVLSQMIFLAPAAILAEAGLSFLGLGDPTMPTWGQILEQGFRTGAVFVGYWWWVIPPGILIIITALTFMLLSLGLEPVVNPRLRRDR